MSLSDRDYFRRHHPDAAAPGGVRALEVVVPDFLAVYDAARSAGLNPAESVEELTRRLLADVAGKDAVDALTGAFHISRPAVSNADVIDDMYGLGFAVGLTQGVLTVLSLLRDRVVALGSVTVEGSAGGPG